MKIQKIFFAMLVVTLIFAACTKEGITYDCSAIAPTYTSDIKAIMDADCATSNCHSASKKADGIDLSSYNATVAEANKAKFMGSINHESGYKAMPEDASQLTTAERQKVYCWIQSGMPQ